MKRITIKLIGIVVPLMMMTACLFEEENIFDKSAALRMNEEIKADIALLTGAENGWLVDYYAEKNYAMGGYAMHWKFLPDGTVDIACEVAVNGVPARQPDNSFWDVKAEQAPVLSFDTYNRVLQHFCEPSQSDIDGLAGDYEFIIRRNVDMGDALVITGKRNGNKLIMRPVKAGEDPIDYLAKVKDFASSVITARNFDFYVNGQPIGTTLFTNGVKGGLSVRAINVQTAIPSGAEGQEAVQDTTVYFAFTPDGFRFNEPVRLGGSLVQHFVWNSEARKYVCTDEGVNVEWVCTDAPPQFNYQAFIGDFTLSYGGTGLATDATVFQELDVSIEADVQGESYRIKGLLLPEFEEEYTVYARYDPIFGLILDAQQIGQTDDKEVWLAVAIWNGTGTLVRNLDYASLRSTDFVEVEGGNPYGTGYSFKLTDNVNGTYPSQPSYFAYGISFRTYPGANANGDRYDIGACSDNYRCYNMSLVKK